MTKPKPYPPTDTAEQMAVTTFECLVNNDRVKLDIRTRDKYPNTDGTIEIVDREQFPLGKLEVQLRTIGAGRKQYSCPTSLVAYSKITTLPVILVCVDSSAHRAFWKQITHHMPEYKENQQSFTIHFSDPLDAIDEDDVYIEKWAEIVTDYQERVAGFPALRKRLKQQLEASCRGDGELNRDLEEVGRLLEVMRGPDQEAQMEVRSLLKQKIEEGQPIAQRLIDGLLAIFINSKDRVAQNHALSALVTLSEWSPIPDLVPQVLKQIERNMQLPEYRKHTNEAWRSPYTDFLFYALVRLQATGVLEDMRHFLAIEDLAVNRNAIRSCGWLALSEAMEDVLRFLGHDDDGVRYDVAQALGRLNRAKVIPALVDILRDPDDELRLAGAIQALAEFGRTQDVATVMRFVDHEHRDVRRAVALFLGTVDPTGHAELLLDMIDDDDYKVRSAAMQSVHRCLPAVDSDTLGQPESSAMHQGTVMSLEDLEKLALPRLSKAYRDRRVPQVASLLPFCRGPQSLPVLADLYLDENSPPMELYEFRGPTGEVEASQEIHLKPLLLNTLKQYDLKHIPSDVAERIEADIVRQIREADSRERHYYVVAAGEMQLDTAFESITTLINQGEAKPRHLAVSALISIDSTKAQDWAMETLRGNPSLEVSIVCFDIIGQAGKKEEASGLIRSQILRLMNDAGTRQNGQVYDYVERYEVREAAPLIISDLTGGPRVEFGLATRMLKTLSMLKTPEGRDVLIWALDAFEDRHKPSVIGWLGNIGDEESKAAIRKYRNHPAFEIRKLVEKVLSDASSADNTSA